MRLNRALFREAGADCDSPTKHVLITRPTRLPEESGPRLLLFCFKEEGVAEWPAATDKKQVRI